MIHLIYFLIQQSLIFMYVNFNLIIHLYYFILEYGFHYFYYFFIQVTN